jgi:hypothetical protein
MEEETQSKPRGGKREGAGRKPKGANGTLRFGFRCSQEVWDIIQRMEDKTAFVEQAIKEKWRRMQ